MSVQNLNYPAELGHGESGKRWKMVLVDFPQISAIGDTIEACISILKGMLAAEIIRRRQSGEHIPNPSQKKALQFTVTPRR